MFKAAVLTISDRCSRGEYSDESGKLIIDIIKGINGEVADYEIVSDDQKIIEEKLIYFCDELKIDIVFTTGGTGIGPRDVTPEATKNIADKIVPGISELMRLEGFKKTKNAMLSRALSVVRNKTLIINLPGSPKAVQEGLTAILDILPHALDMLKGKSH